MKLQVIDLKFKNKIVLITGGSRGIGKSIAKKFVSEGAIVVITSKDKIKLKQTSEELGDLFFVSGDIRNDSDVQNVVKKTIERFGHIDILVNNAGILPTLKSLDKISGQQNNYKQFYSIIFLNLYKIH